MNSTWKKHSLVILCCLATAILLAGCAKKKQDIDPFFEKWKIMAKQSKGHSPSPKPRTLILDEATVEKQVVLEEEKVRREKKLPRRRVTLKMHNANIVNVLQALTRIAGMNMLINSSVQGQVNINVTKAPWDQVFRGILKNQGLDYTWEGNIIRIMTLDEMEQDLKFEAIREKRRAQLIDIQRVDPLLTAIIDVQYADAPGLQKNLEALLTKDKEGKPRGSVVVDESTNSLIIQAIKPDILKMITMMKQLDQPRRQINFRAHIVEATKSTARELGVRWGGVYRGTSGDENFYITPGGVDGQAGVDPLTQQYEGIFGGGISGQGFGINFPTDSATTGGLGTAGASLGLLFGTIGSNILEAQLSALQSNGKLNILSSPSITTLDNQTAYTVNGERVPYVSTSADGTEVKFEDVELRLEITPHIIDKEMLKMKILVKKDEVDTTRSVAGNPFIIKKETETSLISKDGETIVISGLTKDRISQDDDGVPGFKDIPLLGWLFKGQNKSNNMEEVLIFITPHILPEWQPGERQKTEAEIEEEVQKLMQEKKEIQDEKDAARRQQNIDSLLNNQ